MSQDVGHRSRASALAALAFIILALTIAVAADLVVGTRELDDRVKVTGELVEPHAVQVGKTQRELLRLRLLLEAGATDREVQDQAEVVSEAVGETTTSYDAQSDSLRAHAQGLQADWDNAKRRIDESMGTGVLATSARANALDKLEVLEGDEGYDYLLDEAVANGSEHVGAAQEAADDMVGDMTRVLILLAVLFVAGVAASVLAGAVLVRNNRRRIAALDDLKFVNAELEWYSRIVQATDIALTATDRHGRMTWVNEAFERSTGHRLADILGREPREFMFGPATDPIALRKIDEAQALGLPARAELAQYSADGRESWISLDLSPLHDEHGNLEGFFAVQTDITERYEAERLLEEARRAAEASAKEKAGFLATMSHEIRTPLNAVLGLTDLLLLTELDDEQRDYAETAHRSGAHLLALVNDVLDYSALESGRLEYANEPFSIREVVDETLTMFVASAEAKGIELRLQQSPDVPALLRGDAMRLRQVLVNVVGNALKFTDRGSIVVECERVGSPWGHRCEIVLRITDTGIGVPSARIPDLFRSFVRGDGSTTREYGGTGLGLAISRRLVEAMGGTIDLESEVGVGTTVTIRMVHDTVQEAPVPVARPLAAISDHSERQVLVAEDDLVNQKVVVRMLGRIGIVPEVVGNGREAVEAVQTGAYDTVLMDVEMPVMDGLTAVGLIRDLDLPVQPWVIALTANALSGDRDRFLAGGMDDYVSKPVTLDALTGALDRSRAENVGD
ncbi:hybrid sensor histidine kinase/response regulator [Nocardioides dongkuii]|uniref:hybrid sensor histidine kinase/response regulator n=1 Tax=Nocardioides dongkuii TaxID=2760089 RepID=UPI0015FD8D02|nr:ATP-binding protein [Nocardioides dongkuii]